MARVHGGRRPNEKAKDFKGTMKKLIRHIFRSRVCYLWNDIQYCRTEDFRKSNDGDFQWTCK